MRNPVFYIIVFVSFSINTVCAQFSLSAEFRPRTEIRNGFKTPKKEEDKAAFFTEQRTRLNFNYKADSTYSFRVSLQDIRIWGENNQIFKQEDGNTFLSEAWVDYRLHNNLSVKAGRQIISYDNQRYIGGLEWAQQGRRHDAILLKYNRSNGFRFDFGAAFNSDDDVQEPAFIQSPNAQFYSANNYKHMVYTWFNYKGEKYHASFLLMNLGFQTSDSKTTSRQTFGAHGKLDFNPISFGFDIYYQTGKSGNNKVSAYLTGINLTYTTSLSPITIGFELISGKDSDDTSGDIKHFRPDFGTNHAHNGFMDYFFVGPSNGTVGVTDLYIKTKFRLSNGSFTANLHRFYTGSMQLDANGSSLSGGLGTELDLVYGIGLKRGSSLNLGISLFGASETMKALRNGDRDINSWAWVMWTVKPQLWSSDN